MKLSKVRTCDQLTTFQARKGTGEGGQRFRKNGFYDFPSRTIGKWKDENNHCLAGAWKPKPLGHLFSFKGPENGEAKEEDFDSSSSGGAEYPKAGHLSKSLEGRKTRVQTMANSGAKVVSPAAYIQKFLHVESPINPPLLEQDLRHWIGETL